MVRNINPTIKKEAGKRIAYIREEIMNMKQAEFAQLIGTTAQNLSGIERGVNGFGIDTLMEICNKTNTSPDYILYGRGNNYLYEKIKEEFFGLDRNQIEKAFDILKKMALFIQTDEEEKKA